MPGDQALNWTPPQSPGVFATLDRQRRCRRRVFVDVARAVQHVRCAQVPPRRVRLDLAAPQLDRLVETVGPRRRHHRRQRHADRVGPRRPVDRDHAETQAARCDVDPRGGAARPGYRGAHQARVPGARRRDTVGAALLNGAVLERRRGSVDVDASVGGAIAPILDRRVLQEARGRGPGLEADRRPVARRLRHLVAREKDGRCRRPLGVQGALVPAPAHVEPGGRVEADLDARLDRERNRGRRGAVDVDGSGHDVGTPRHRPGRVRRNSPGHARRSRPRVGSKEPDGHQQRQ